MARQTIQNANASLYLPNGSYSSSTVIAGLSAGFTFGCWFKISTVGTTCRIITNSESENAIATMGIGTSGGTLRGGYYNGSYQGAKSSSPLNPNQWYHGVYTYDGTNGNLYVNGQLDNASTNVPTAATTTTLRIGDASAGVKGNVREAVVYTRALTATEVASLYGGTIPTGATAVYPLNEGAGTVAYDTSGNGNNGTITSGTWSREAPTKTRKLVNNNLVYNGDFEIAPVVNVATTAGDKWIDGTASGAAATADPVFGWYVWNYTTSYAAMFDTSVKHSGTASMKLSTTATASTVGLKVSVNNSQGFKKNNIPVLPSTSYTYSVWIKTQANSGSATTGTRFQLVTTTGVSDVLTTTVVTGLVATQDWTQYTGTVTTGATARYITPLLQIVGNDGAGTLIMDAWFDDIQLYPTTAITRSAATGRLTATGRSAA